MRKRRVAVVGSEKESRRVMELLNRISPGVEIAGSELGAAHCFPSIRIAFILPDVVIQSLDGFD